MQNKLFNQFEISMFKNNFFSKTRINNYYKKDIKKNNKHTRKDYKIDCYNMLMFILICIFHPENGYISILNKTKLFLIKKSKSSEKIIKSITASGICKARKRFSSIILKTIWQVDLLKKFYNKNTIKLWNGLKICAVDGTTFTLNKSKNILNNFPLLNQAFYPKMIVCVLYDIYSKIPLDIETGNYKCGERRMLSALIERLKGKTLLLLDRGYTGYWIYHKLYLLKTQFIIRIPHNIKYKILKKINENDFIIELILYNKAKENYKKNLSEKEYRTLPDSIKLRLIKSSMKGFRTRFIITSLLDYDKYYYNDICKLYCDRWIIENYYRDLKHILKVEKFHAKYVDGIYQEIYASMILTIILQQYISEAATTHSVFYEDISIKKTYFILIDIIFSNEITENFNSFLYDFFIKTIAFNAQKKRPGRHCKREFYRKKRCYDYKSR